MATYYTVKEGETISDVVLNATGSIDNWFAILDANDMTSWVPTITTGDLILIPDSVILQPNVQRNLQIYPANNRSEISNLNVQMNNFVAILQSLTIKDFQSTEEFYFEDNLQYEFET